MPGFCKKGRIEKGPYINKIKMKRKVIIIIIVGLAFVYLMTIFLAFANVIVYPQFYIIPVCFTVILGSGFAIYKGRSKDKKASIYGVLILFAVLLTACFLYLALLVGNPRQRHQEFPSPKGDRVIVMEFDFMDRPSLYLKHGLFMLKLYKLNQVYNETVTYRINWLDHDTVELVSMTYPETENLEISVGGEN